MNRHFIGGFKFWIDRLRTYMGWVQAFLIFDIWRQGRFSFIGALFIFIPVLLVLMAFDRWVIYPGESKESWRQNPEWMALKGDIQEIKKHLGIK